MNKNNISFIFCTILASIFILNGCGLTPIKKEATRKKIHTKDRPSLEETREAKPSKERNIKKAKEVIKTASTHSKLIFSSNRTGNLEIWLSDFDGKKPVQLTTDDNYESFWPRVSPDRTKVLFYRVPMGEKENAYDQFSLWQLNLNDQTLEELIPNNNLEWVEQGFANWSPDGSQIIMAATKQKGSWHLYITDASGKNPRRISKRESIYLDPSWSPDGSKIVFTALPESYDGRELNHLEVFIADADGNNEERLTFDKYRDHDPYWSPDGNWVAYETEVKPQYWLLGKRALRISNASNAKTFELLNDGHANTLPRWSSDSKQIYFHRFRFREDKQFSIWRIDADGNNLVKIYGSDRHKNIQVDIF